MSKSASLPAQPFDEFEPRSSEAATPAWKQEVNQRLAAHRTRRGGVPEAASGLAPESPRTASARAAEAAARVAARYAKAPSYSQLLAGEARAVVRAAGAAAEAARNAQAAAQAVLAGLESGPMAEDFWEPIEPMAQPATANPTPSQMVAPGEQAAPPRWQDEPPAAVLAQEQHQTYESPQTGTQTGTRAGVRAGVRTGAQPRWEEALPVPPSAAGPDVWSEMRVHPVPESAHEYRRDPRQHYKKHYPHPVDEGELFPQDSYAPYGSFDAMASATVEPVQHLPANLIEFPRELTATRKARPRLAEGPFYDDSHANSQLSIFEVDPDLLAPPIRLNGAMGETVAPPEWASIELDHRAEADHAEHAYAEAAYVDTAHLEAHYAQAHQQAHQGTQIAASVADASRVDVSRVSAPVARSASPAQAEAPRAVRTGHVNRVDRVEHAGQVESGPRRPARTVAPEPEKAVELLVASFSDRMLATVVDAALVTLAFLAAAVVVIASTAHPPTGRIALIASGCGWLIFGLLYQYLFLSYAEEGTPGMRYARIALCTFDDDNPSREQMRKRIPALLLSAAPAGLGLLWAVFDGDNLGWHDRLTRTYQRKY